MKRALLPALLLAVAAPLSGCGLFECADDEYDRNGACDRVAKAVRSSLSTCGLDVIPVAQICEAGCVADGTYCEKRDGVDLCVAAVRGVSCDQMGAAAWWNLEACAWLLSNFAEACADAADDSSSWD